MSNYKSYISSLRSLILAALFLKIYKQDEDGKLTLFLLLLKFYTSVLTDDSLKYQLLINRSMDGCFIHPIHRSGYSVSNHYRARECICAGSPSCCIQRLRMSSRSTSSSNLISACFR